jgi:alcohol dehydrogenase, propanol-preferring
MDMVHGNHLILSRCTSIEVCRTDLHVIDGELARPKLPLVPSHEVVGRFDALGDHVDSGLKLGDRVGIPWLAHTCGVCSYRIHGHENLCDEPQFTGYTCDGGFATSIIPSARYAFPLPEGCSDAALAPRDLCAPPGPAIPPNCLRIPSIRRLYSLLTALWSHKPPACLCEGWCLFRGRS